MAPDVAGAGQIPSKVTYFAILRLRDGAQFFQGVHAQATTLVLREAEGLDRSFR